MIIVQSYHLSMIIDNDLSFGIVIRFSFSLFPFHPLSLSPSRSLPHPYIRTYTRTLSLSPALPLPFPSAPYCPCQSESTSRVTDFPLALNAPRRDGTGRKRRAERSWQKKDGEQSCSRRQGKTAYPLAPWILPAPGRPFVSEKGEYVSAKYRMLVRVSPIMLPLRKSYFHHIYRHWLSYISTLGLVTFYL